MAPDDIARAPTQMVAIALLLTVACSLPVFLTGALAVQIRSELDFGVAALGIAVAVFKGSGAVLAAPLGKVIDTVGPSAAMRSAAAISVAASLGIALVAHSWLILCVFLALGGTGHVAAQTSANLLLARVVPLQKQGFAFGLKQCALPVGSMVAGLLVPLIALTVGWRFGFLAAALAATAVGIGIPAPDAVFSSAEPVAPDKSDKSAPLFVLAAALFFGMVAASTLSAFTVDAAVSVGISPGAAGIILTMGSAAAVIVRLFAGVLADRRGGAHLRNVSISLVGGVGGYLMLSLQTNWVFAVGAAVAFGFGWGFNGLFWFSIMRVNQSTPGRATGIVMPGGLIGGLVGPIVFGWIVESSGYPAAWRFAAFSATIGAALMLWGRALLRADVAR